MTQSNKCLNCESNTLSLYKDNSCTFSQCDKCSETKLVFATCCTYCRIKITDTNYSCTKTNGLFYLKCTQCLSKT